MKEPSRAAPLQAALRVKDLAVDLAGDLAGGYRRSTRYFKLRLAVLGAWTLLSLLTLVLVCSPSSASNSLDAEAQLSEGLLGTQIMVLNGSDRVWTDVTLTLEGGYQVQVPTLRGGQRLVVAASRFTKDGAGAPQELRPRTLTIRCEQGSATAALSARGP